MKKVVLVLLAMIILSACSSQDTPPATTDANQSAQSPKTTMLDEGVWPTNITFEKKARKAGTNMVK